MLIQAAVCAHRRNDGQPLGQSQGGLEALCQALLQALAHPKAIDHRFNVVFVAQAKLGQRAIEVDQFTIDAGAHKALGPQALQQLHVLTLAVAHQGCQQHQRTAFRQGHGAVDHLRDGLRFQWLVVLRAARGADAGKHQS